MITLPVALELLTTIIFGSISFHLVLCNIVILQRRGGDEVHTRVFRVSLMFSVTLIRIPDPYNKMDTVLAKQKNTK